MVAKTAPVNPSVLAWAIAERGITSSELAQSLKVQEAMVEEWLRGDSRPTLGNWTELAKQLRRPKSVFLLPAPPASSVPPALRTSAGRGAHSLERDELLQVRRARRLQRYLSAVFALSGREAPQLPQSQRGDDPELVAARLRAWLSVDANEQLQWASSSVALREWRAALEERGVLVLQQSIGKRAVRGYSIGDTWAPVIAVNSAETNEARIFTLMHELAHLSARTDSACALPPRDAAGGSSLEAWCDRVSAAVLMPRSSVIAVATGILEGPRAPKDEIGLARRTATRYRTSLRAAALRLIAVGLADKSLYGAVEEKYPNRDRDKGGGGGGGGTPAPELRVRELGQLGVSGVLDGFDQGQLTERDARSLLRLDGAELADASLLITGSP